MELPSHPESDDSKVAPMPLPDAPSRTTRVVVAVLIGLVAVVVVLHLTGVVGPAR